MFTTKYTDTKKPKSEVGSRFSPVFSLTTKESGSLDLEITGEKDTYAEIQSYAQSVDIKNIMLRYEAGDESCLTKKQGQFIDVTDMPTNFADVMKTVIVAEDNFNKLPLEVRREYNFSAAEYIADIGSQRWLDTLGIKSNKEAEEIGTDQKKGDEIKDEQKQ